MAGAQLFDERGRAVLLRGGNLDDDNAIDDAGADRLLGLGFNFVRLRITFKPETTDPDTGRVLPATIDPRRQSQFTADYEQAMDGWIRTLAAHGVWMLIEFRADDVFTSNEPGFYDPSKTGPLDDGGVSFANYKQAWVELVKKHLGDDYVAGYGLLAEPSLHSALQKAKRPFTPSALSAFHRGLMDAISHEAGDRRTPFFVGTDWNYSSFQYRFDSYYEDLADAGYAGRLVYEVNFLRPKPWIDSGKDWNGASATWDSYTPPLSFDELITPLPGEKYATDGGDLDQILSDRLRGEKYFEWAMTTPFIGWYLSPALAFRQRHQVPMVVDQYGASVGSLGQLSYERALLDTFADAGLSSARWGYNTKPADRAVAGNPSVEVFYQTYFAAHPQP